MSPLRGTLTASLIAITAFAEPRMTGDVRTSVSDNRASAGALRDGVLTMDLEARVGMWHPDGDDSPGARLPAFAEAGRAPQIPGPLIRVRAGTEVTLTLRNRLERDTLVVYGLHDRQKGAVMADAGVRLAPQERRAVHFRLDEPGTYYYWGTTTGRDVTWRTGEDAQLTGAIVVDPANGPLARDRIFVVGMWADTVARAYTDRRRILTVINGRSWPATERLRYTVGDTVRWRIINASGDNHPFHLHGAYFRITSRGDGRGDTSYVGDAVSRAVTGSMSPGTTMTIEWIPERPGNWLFHCHLPEHFGRRASLGLRAARVEHGAHLARDDMSGLVMGVHVRPAPGRSVVLGGAQSASRHLRLLIRSNTGSSRAVPIYGYTIQEGATAPPRDSGLHSGPPLVLVRGEPVSITVVNELDEPTTVHWHGIELESYYDGVAGFSGSPLRVAPSIAPRDSFIARFTPPHAGTFIYHTHVEEERQEPAGLSGALIVVEPGQHWDESRDHPVLITSPWGFEAGRTAVLVNGSASPRPHVVTVGVPQRFRFINMTTRRPALSLELRRDSTLVQWREVAKDGADVPQSQQMLRAAAHQISVGETLDVEFTPTEPGEMRLDVKLGGHLPVHPVLATLPLRAVTAR